MWSNRFQFTIPEILIDQNNQTALHVLIDCPALEQGGSILVCQVWYIEVHIHHIIW